MMGTLSFASPTSALLATSALFARPAVPPRATFLMMQYSTAQPTEYGEQQEYAQVVWSLAGFNGVTGFSGMATNEPSPFPTVNRAFDASSERIYQKDYTYLPYTLRNGEQQVLSRWNMAQQQLTVSRKQCKIIVAADGTATLISKGRGPTMVRSRPAEGWPERSEQWYRYNGPMWNALYAEEQHVLADGDQVSLDCNDPEAAVFTCQVDYAQPEGYAQQQQGYVQQQQDFAQQQQAYAQQELPAGWVMGIDEASGATYYYNQQTGQSQWEPQLSAY